MLWFVQETLELFSKDGYMVNIGYFDYEKYSFFKALAGDTAIIWSSYKYHMYSNIFFYKKSFL